MESRAFLPADWILCSALCPAELVGALCPEAFWGYFHQVCSTHAVFLIFCFPSTTGCVENGGRDQEDPWHLSGDV